MSDFLCDIRNFGRVSVFKQTKRRKRQSTKEIVLMKTIKLIGTALVSTILLGNVVFAQGTINKRERRQQERIADGVKDGELTQKEARKLEKEQAKIHTAEAKARADGELTAKERAKIQKRQSKASHHIYKEKHDRQTR
jgi:hypothetical protein